MSADILALARHFAAEAGRPAMQLDAAAERLLLRHAWPGNARELRNAVERALLLTDGVIRPEHLPDRVRLDADQGVRAGDGKAASGTETPARSYRTVRDEMRALERRRIVEALEACGWNQSRAAQRLDMSRRTLVAKLTAYDIPRRGR